MNGIDASSQSESGCRLDQLPRIIPVWGNIDPTRLLLLYHTRTVPLHYSLYLYLYLTMSGRPSTSSATHTQSAPTVPPAIHNLAVPPPSLIDSQLPSYLLPNVLDLLRESTNHVISRKRKEEDTLREEGLLPGKGKGKATPEDEARAVEEEMNRKVERIGLMVGSYIAEKYVPSFLHITQCSSQIDIGSSSTGFTPRYNQIHL
jgi:hypothetical protein